MTLLSLEEGKPLVLSLVGATQINWIDIGSSYASPFLEVGNERKGFVFARVSNDRVEVSTGKEIRSMRPLIQSLPLETTIFANHFTMLIPDEVQRQFFKNKFEDSRSFNKRTLASRYGYGLERVGSYVKFDLDSAINDRWTLWRDYIKLATYVEEARTTHPEVINYTVSLDLGLLCRYGQHLNALRSKRDFN